LSRIIKLDGTGKQRNRLTRSIVFAIRILMQQTEINQETRDIASYIALALNAIFETIDTTVEPWEKRGYWVKADRFRMKWAWTNQLADDFTNAVLDENWQEVAILTAKLTEKLNDVDVPKNNRLGAPWIGSWEELKKRSLQK
jgi:hypothetical protein